MSDARYQHLSEADRRYALRVAQDTSRRRAFLLEKDIWVVATLDVLFAGPFSGHLIFKGGTSLSKVWQAIRRFSEDVDITCDIRAFAPDLVAGAGEEALPPTRSQQKRWTRAIRARLDEWKTMSMVPGSTMGPQFREACSLCHRATHLRNLPTITQGWWPTACYSTMPSRSMRLWSVAPQSRHGPTPQGHWTVDGRLRLS